MKVSHLTVGDEITLTANLGSGFIAGRVAEVIAIENDGATDMRFVTLLRYAFPRLRRVPVTERFHLTADEEI